MSKKNTNNPGSKQGGIMKPLIILPKGAMSEKDKEKLTENNICVVEAEDPGLVKFVDSIPAIASRTEIEQAAIKLSRKILKSETWEYGKSTSSEMAKMFVEILIKGTPLDPSPTQAEQEKQIFDQAKAAELQRIAREEAKAERAAAKAAKQKKEPSSQDQQPKGSGNG